MYDFHAWLTPLISPVSLSVFVLISGPVCAAMQQVADNVGETPNSTGAKDIDLLFLRGIMESPIVRVHLCRGSEVQSGNVSLVFLFL